MVAFYLPQFHPIPENDAWWGPGFTEWTNVVRARPQFRGHYQPHLPRDLGFYDLRLPEAREAQAALAQAYGLAGFCYYHYWFNGRRLLERPFSEVLSSGKPELPFALCWANENWTRVWDGGANEVLMAQAYSTEDDIAHFRHLADAFRDPRYIRVDDRPLFLVYRVSRLPDPARTAETWRSEAKRLGLPPPYLCRVESFDEERQGLPEDIGFDASVEWMPNWASSARRKYQGLHWKLARKARLASRGPERHIVVDYDELVARMIMERTEPTDHVQFPCVVPSWDNSPRRRRNAVIFEGANPESYRRWLAHAVDRSAGARHRAPLVFVNAWHEWAEGSHLEPDERWGHRYLEVTQEEIIRVRGSRQ